MSSKVKLYMCGLKYPNGLFFALYSCWDAREAARWVDDNNKKYGNKHKDACFTFEEKAP